MEWMGLNEIREAYLAFFEGKSHLRMESFPLVPADDNSLLLINSGMAPLKKFFLGEATPPSRRVTTCQKCIRTPDIENVGKTARHGTFFEMLGNFSFGDYFKREAIQWAWEFVTEVVKLPSDRIHISVFQDDEEAYDIWVREMGIDPEHMVHLGREDNFWEHGSGPCGPCSELYYDRGEAFGCGKPDCAPGCDCDRYVEFWNLVFTQFESDGKGTYTPIDHPNIDTGMGLERMACIMQEVNNLFEVDTVQNIMKHIARLAQAEYGKDEKSDVSLRVITDHIRSTVFMVGDGVLPSNEGRGYVLRRLLRRAARHGRLLGISGVFLDQVASTVIGENEKAYPNLKENEAYIVRIIRAEEERFSKTIDQGMEMLEHLLLEGKQKEERVFSGENAFKLYDTYGFPMDLTKEILLENHLELDEENFKVRMEEQRLRARKARMEGGGSSWGTEIVLSTKEPTVFVGYTTFEVDTTVVDIIADGALVGEVFDGSECVLVLQETPFYAEGGGQVGDHGIICSKEGKMVVTGCRKNAAGQFLHLGYVKEGFFKKGEKVTARIDQKRRAAITRNHTGVHLLQAALRTVLGEHVHQSGSYVDEHRLRFDFTHFDAVTGDELVRVEQLVNEKVLEGLPVTTDLLPVEEAKAGGAIALFGEKYDSTVRVIHVGGFSSELCGGCHVDNSAKLGLFHILSEASVAAGVRRIEATTGFGVLKELSRETGVLEEVAKVFKLPNPAELLDKAKAVAQEMKEKNREIDSLHEKLAGIVAGKLEEAQEKVGETILIKGTFTAENTEMLRMVAESLKQRYQNGVIVLANVLGEKGNLLVYCGKEAVKEGLLAGKIVKEIASIAEGSGGGKPDNAMAGIKSVEKIPKALLAAGEIVAKMKKG